MNSDLDTILHYETILSREQPGLMRWILLWIMPLLRIIEFNDKNFDQFSYLNYAIYYVMVIIYVHDIA